MTKTVSRHYAENSEWNLEIIDTPGLCDTEGLEEDLKHLVLLGEFLRTTTRINIVLIFFKNENNRLTPSMIKCYQQLRKFFPDKADCIFPVVTYSDGNLNVETSSVIKECLGID